ncbi:probable low-specificity L-threonine aldolase 2 isoform X2 [Pyrgilauda ruficollis]|uniref:probable low-specificity L-threonine aldolase 2 isoform X2 n=1 Tax=Pyrgilauda ruficollis TaxID=221976 RepID=UPI001B8620A9|nr:probable low-specificity L-threonine aldolase 2 isoform X2 [Pyrgilauda ruficollis]
MRTVLRRGWLPGPGGRQPRGPAAAPPLVVDLRSDTVTRPCAGMRRAMARAAVGDDDYGEDPAVNELQRRAAATLGTESALFVPTATMANLIAVMCHCQRRGTQLFLGRDAHLHVYEHGGAAQVAGVHSQALPDLPNGTFDLEQLEQAIREAHGSQYHPRPELICLENTHSSAGGRALPLTYLRQGLGAPAGAVLAGCRQFVAEAWRVRKLLGGGMRQVGVLAAAARLGLQHAEATLRRDHDNARRFAEGIHVLDSPLCSVNLAAVETNIVMVNIQGAWPSPTELCDRLRAVSEEEEAETGQAVSVLLFPWSARTVRAVWHRNISARDTELARRKLEFVARKCQEELALGLHPMPPGSGGA